MRYLVLQGANMAWLGRREPHLYGTTTAAELDAMLRREAEAQGDAVEIFYTHIEGEAVGRLYEAAEAGIDGAVVNPAGFVHAGYALRDCMRTVPFPCIEVHMTNIDRRGIHSATGEAAHGIIAGFGIRSYFLGAAALRDVLAGRAGPKPG
jgi:3-dehydroquinate dehydratase-2